MSLKLLSHSEQVAAHLRSELMEGRWRNLLPGVHKLSKDLDVNHNTVHAALHLLESEGLLSGQGRGRPRQITLPSNVVVKKTLRVKILCYEWMDRGRFYGAELLSRLQAAGVAADFAKKSLQDLGNNVNRVARYVGKHPADAWVIIGGSLEILDWFAKGPVPAIAMFGRFTGVDIAASAPLKGPVLSSVVRRLNEMGHQRMVMLARHERRLPNPGPLEQRFLDELKAQGLTVGEYNLPNWEENPVGLRSCLDSLFGHTPPTALIVSEPAVYLEAERHLAQKGIAVPEQVSMLCTEYDPVFSWHKPLPSHIASDFLPVINRVLRWVNNVALGKKDLSQKTFKAKLVDGGTLRKR